MSILIKGMEMPKHAGVNEDKDTVYRCIVIAHPDSSAELVIDTKFASPYDNGHNVKRCPLVEVPTPHGRLIDADKLVWFIDNHIASGKKWVKFETIKDMINSLPIVELPAAHWIRHTPDKNIMQEFHKQGIGRGMSENSIFWTCSNCGGWGNLSFNYCPSCSAKIEEAEQALKLKERENDAE